MKLVTRLLTVFYVMLLAVSASAAELTAVAQLSEQFRGMNSLTARFEQKITDDKGKILQTASGVMSVKRPKRLHWQTRTPYEHLIVTDGDILWLYDIDLEQVTKQTFSADLDKAPGLLLSGEVEQIASQYDVKLVTGSGKASDPNKKTFELLPRSSAGLFSRLTIVFSGPAIASMTLKDSFDQHTLIEFSEVKLNPSLDDALFRFKAPDGIDVIDNDQ